MRIDVSSGRKLTYEDFVRFPDDGQRHELIDGVHYVTPSPIRPHQRILGNLYYLIRSHIEEHGGGEAFLSPFDVVFSVHDVVEPDLLFVSAERSRILTEENVQGSPDLLIEILSPSTRRRDEGVKLRLYSAQDVREYWVIDPGAEAIRVYRRLEGKLTMVLEIVNDTDAVLTSPVLPGLQLDLSRVFKP